MFIFQPKLSALKMAHDIPQYMSPELPPSHTARQECLEKTW